MQTHRQVQKWQTHVSPAACHSLRSMLWVRARFELLSNAAAELKRQSAANDKADSFMEAFNPHCSMTVVWEYKKN